MERQTCTDVPCTWMVLKICTHARQVDNNVNTKPLEYLCIADTTQLQKLGCLYGTGRDNCLLGHIDRGARRQSGCGKLF